MKFRFVIAILILLLACGLQFLFASAGVFINLILAALVAFAFFFDFFEVAVLVLFATLMVNWQPAFSIEIMLFILIPLVAFTVCTFFSLTPSIGIPAVIAGGFLVLYLATAPGAFMGNLSIFALDLIVSLLFGELVLVALKKAEK